MSTYNHAQTYTNFFAQKTHFYPHLYTHTPESSTKDLTLQEGNRINC